MSRLIDDIAELALPGSLITRSDLSRLVREVERVDEAMRSAAIRQGVGQSEGAELSVSEGTTEFLELNDLTFGDKEHRERLIERLRQLITKAPVVHLTFADSARRTELEKIVMRLRQAVNSQIVLSVGMQPSLIGGMVARTSNRVFDFSIRRQLEQARGVIRQELELLG